MYAYTQTCRDERLINRFDYDIHTNIHTYTHTYIYAYTQTCRDERLINRFDYDGDYGTVLNRFLMQVINVCIPVYLCTCVCMHIQYDDDYGTVLNRFLMQVI